MRLAAGLLALALAGAGAVGAWRATEGTGAVAAEPAAIEPGLLLLEPGAEPLPDILPIRRAPSLPAILRPDRVVPTQAFGLAAPAPTLRGLETGAEAAGWEAVGRLDIGGKGFCTGTLIGPALVLTAAHCLYDRDSGAAVDPGRIEFRAGLRQGASAASRTVRRAMAHPGYVYDPAAGADESARDLALLELAEPIDGRVHPFETAAEVGAGALVSVVSYAVGRSEVPSREEGCGVIGTERGVLVLTCDVDFGSSGAPIFRMDGSIARIVSVVSAKGLLDGRRVALGTSLTEPLAELRAAFEALGAPVAPPPRLLRPGERSGGGALFVTAAVPAP